MNIYYLMNQNDVPKHKSSDIKVVREEMNLDKLILDSPVNYYYEIPTSKSPGRMTFKPYIGKAFKFNFDAFGDMIDKDKFDLIIKEGFFGIEYDSKKLGSRMIVDIYSK